MIQVATHALLHQWIPAVMSLYQILMVVVGMVAMERVATETVMVTVASAKREAVGVVILGAIVLKAANKEITEVTTAVVGTTREAAMAMVLTVDARTETVGMRMEAGTVNRFSALASVTASATATAITTSQKRKYHHQKKAE